MDPTKQGMTTLVKQWSASRYRKFKPGGEMSFNIEAQSYDIRDRAKSGQVKLPPPGLERPARRPSMYKCAGCKVPGLCCKLMTSVVGETVLSGDKSLYGLNLGRLRDSRGLCYPACIP